MNYHSQGSVSGFFACWDGKQRVDNRTSNAQPKHVSIILGWSLNIGNILNGRSPRNIFKRIIRVSVNFSKLKNHNIDEILRGRNLSEQGNNIWKIKMQNKVSFGFWVIFFFTLENGLYDFIDYIWPRGRFFPFLENLKGSTHHHN